MENNFKFGDRVKHQKYGIGFVIQHVANIAEVIFEDRAYRDVKVIDIALIPHPDTVRLDFMDNSNHSMFANNRFTNSSREEVVYDHRYVINHNDMMLGFGSTYREAIDNAMEKEKSS